MQGPYLNTPTQPGKPPFPASIHGKLGVPVPPVPMPRKLNRGDWKRGAGLPVKGHPSSEVPGP